MEDDPDDRMLMKEALYANYLHRRGRFQNEAILSPTLNVLDLNMPKVDGREALKLIKSDRNFQRSPVSVLTKSQSERDIFQIYHLGVNSFIFKPARFDHLMAVARSIVHYWFATVALPKRSS